MTGESIPIRLFLAGYELTPTMKDINKKFSCRYYLNLVLVDEEERRYFKQQVITAISMKSWYWLCVCVGDNSVEESWSEEEEDVIVCVL